MYVFTIALASPLVRILSPIDANLLSARIHGMHVPNLRRLLPLIILVNTDSIDPQSAIAMLLAYSLKGVPKMLSDAESRCAVDSDGAAQYRRATAIRERVEWFRRIQLFDCQVTIEGFSESASLEAEDPDPRSCSVGHRLQICEPSVVGVQCFGTRHICLHGQRRIVVLGLVLLAVVRIVGGLCVVFT